MQRNHAERLRTKQNELKLNLKELERTEASTKIEVEHSIVKVKSQREIREQKDNLAR